MGPTIEERIAQDSSKRKISQEDYDQILAKFNTIWENSERGDEGVRTVGKRIQKLI